MSYRLRKGLAPGHYPCPGEGTLLLKATGNELSAAQAEKLAEVIERDKLKAPKRRGGSAQAAKKKEG